MNGRPYNPDQLTSLVESMRDNGSAVVAMPAVPNPAEAPPYQPVFEHHHGFLVEGRFALQGLGRLFTRHGRVERAEMKAEEYERRAGVNEFVADRIMRPRAAIAKPLSEMGWVGGPNPQARELIGWVGTHRLGTHPKREEDHSNLGFQLIDSKNVSRGAVVPNVHRPTTASEERASRRLERLAIKSRNKSRESRWLSDSYGPELSRSSGHVLSNKERRHLRHQARKIEKLDRKSSKTEADFERVADDSALIAVAERKRRKADRITARASAFYTRRANGTLIRQRAPRAAARGAVTAVKVPARGAKSAASRAAAAREARRISKLPPPPTTPPTVI